MFEVAVAGQDLDILLIRRREFSGDVDVNCLKYAIKHYKDKDNLGIGQIDALNLPLSQIVLM